MCLVALRKHLMGQARRAARGGPVDWESLASAGLLLG